MDAKKFHEIPLKDYPSLSDEILDEIMAYYGQTYDNSASGFVDVKYKYAHEIMTLRVNKRLVEETAKLAEKTLKVAKWTMVVGIGTVIVALGALGSFYVMSLPK